ncbi:MAG: NAD(P)H-binding protein [Candidatus Dormibacteria bacterium]|jgi:putative NADH-flavin reductase
MRLSIVGATGGVGRCLLEQAVDAEHAVTAIVRDPRRLTRQIRTVTVDLSAPDPEIVRAAVMGSDAVLSGLGARTSADHGVVERGTRALIEAMRASGVRRIVVVSAAPIGTVDSPGRPHPPRHDPGDGLVMRYVGSPLVKRAFAASYADLARMEDALRESDLEWTAVRPPRLTDGALTGRYRTAYGRNLRRGLSISRADVAHLMLRLVERPEAVGQTVGIAR